MKKITQIYDNICNYLNKYFSQKKYAILVAKIGTYFSTFCIGGAFVFFLTLGFDLLVFTISALSLIALTLGIYNIKQWEDVEDWEENENEN